MRIARTHKTKWGGITINYPYKSCPWTPGGFDSAADYLRKCVSFRERETRYKVTADEGEKRAQMNISKLDLLNIYEFLECLLNFSPSFLSLL